MSALIGLVIRTAIGLLAGVGIGAVLDKVAADKLPAYPEGGLGLHEADITGGGRKLSIPKILYIVFAGVLAAVVLNFIGKKFNVSILKK
jgi:hypothetical protein